jgi:hypothetical protein
MQNIDVKELTDENSESDKNRSPILGRTPRVPVPDGRPLVRQFWDEMEVERKVRCHRRAVEGQCRKGQWGCGQLFRQVSSFFLIFAVS